LLELESFSFLNKKQTKAAQAGNPEDGRRSSLGGMLRNSIDLSSALGQKSRSAGWTREARNGQPLRAFLRKFFSS
jgi:hypothetical protein